MTIVDTPKGIHVFRLLSLRGALHLELKGLKRGRGPTTYSIIKKEFGFRGNRERVYEQFCEYVEEQLGNYHAQLEHSKPEVPEEELKREAWD